MSKKSKKYDTEPTAEVAANPTGLGAEIAAATEGQGEPSEPKPPRAPRISHPRYTLTSVEAEGVPSVELKFTHYALPTRRAPTGKVLIDGVEVDFTVTKSTSRDKTEDRAYSYLKLPNEATGYVSVELVAGASYALSEKAPAAPFGREPKSATEGTGSDPATLPRAEMPQEA